MPEVVLVHGSWHGAWCWDGVVAELHGQGVAASAVDLPFTSFADDVAVVRAAIRAAGSGAVVCAHSYGGLVATEAASGLEGVDGIARLVYATAFMLDEGEEMGQLLMASKSPLLDAITVDENGVWVDPSRVPDLFYGTSPPSVAQECAARLRPMSAGGEPPILTGPPAWKAIASTYVTCTHDRAIPLALQQQMAVRADQVIEWDSDHSPFLARAGDLANLIASYA